MELAHRAICTQEDAFDGKHVANTVYPYEGQWRGHSMYDHKLNVPQH